VVVDKKLGLVLASRSTVAQPLGDVELTFGGTVMVEAAVVFIHPVHSIVLLRYDPEQVQGMGVQEVRFPATAPVMSTVEPGDSLTMVGLDYNQHAFCLSVTCNSLGSFSLVLPSPPRFRDRNLEVISLGETIRGFGGIFIDDDGAMIAYKTVFAFQSGKKRQNFWGAVPVEVLRDFVEQARRQEHLGVTTLECEFNEVTLAEARHLGLDNDWTTRLVEHSPNRRQALSVARVQLGGATAGILQEGDILLAINGRPVVRFLDTELPGAVEGQTVTLDVLRAGSVLSVSVEPAVLRSDGAERVVTWQGMQCVVTPRPIAERGVLPKGVARAGEGVFCSATASGSPADTYWIGPEVWITGINGTPVHTLDDLLALDQALPADDWDAEAVDDDRRFVRVTVVDMEGREQLETMRPDWLFFPTVDLRLKAGEWTSTLGRHGHPAKG